MDPSWDPIPVEWIRHGLLLLVFHILLLLICRYGCFLKWWYPQNTPKWSFLVGKPMVVGYHHFRKPAYDAAWRIDQRNSTWTQPRQWQRDVSRKTHLSLQIFLWKKRGYLQVNLIPILLILTLTLKKKTGHYCRIIGYYVSKTHAWVKFRVRKFIACPFSPVLEARPNNRQATCTTHRVGRKNMFI